MKKCFFFAILCVLLFSSCSVLFNQFATTDFSIDVSNIVKTVSKNAGDIPGGGIERRSDQTQFIFVTIRLIGLDNNKITITKTVKIPVFEYETDSFNIIHEQISGNQITFSQVPYGRYDIRAYVFFADESDSTIRIGADEIPYVCYDDDYDIKYNLYLPYQYYAQKTQTINIATKSIDLPITVFNQYYNLNIVDLLDSPLPEDSYVEFISDGEHALISWGNEEEPYSDDYGWYFEVDNKKYRILYSCNEKISAKELNETCSILKDNDFTFYCYFTFEYTGYPPL